MFFWTKTRRDGHRARDTRRAFRPEADRLESREVLSTLGPNGTIRPTVGSTTPLSFNTGQLNFTNFGSLVNGLGAAAGNFGSFVNTGNFGNINTAQFGRNPGTAPSIFNSQALGSLGNNTTSTTAGAPATTANLIHTPTSVGRPTRTLPREPGTPNIGSTNLLGANTGFSTVGTGFTSSNNPALTNSTGVTNGLAFTNGLGFSNGSNTRFGTTNGAQTGLAFTNVSGFGNPTGTFFNSTLGNGAQTGLAFTNGTGGTLPASTTGLVNSTTTGLTFGGGSGFSNQANNPFFNFGANSNPFSLNTLTPIASGTSLVSPGLNGGGLTIGNTGTSFGTGMFL